MSITVKQLETLAAHFHFDINEARQVIGLSIKSKESGYNRKEKEINYPPGFNNNQPQLCVKKVKEDKQVKERKSRGPTGYNIFVREQCISFSNAGASWRALSDGEREYWNTKAKS